MGDGRLSVLVFGLRVQGLRQNVWGGCGELSCMTIDNQTMIIVGSSYKALGINCRGPTAKMVAVVEGKAEKQQIVGLTSNPTSQNPEPICQRQMGMRDVLPTNGPIPSAVDA